VAPRGLQTIADILADRSERPRVKESRARPATADIGSSGKSPQIVITPRICSAICGIRVGLRCSCHSSTILRRNQSCRGRLDKSETSAQPPPLIAALDNDDPSQRVLVIYALETLHAKEAVPRVLTLVNDDRKSRFGALVTVSEAAKAAIAKLK
jgi:hypothetical protein